MADKQTPSPQPSRMMALDGAINSGPPATPRPQPPKAQMAAAPVAATPAPPPPASKTPKG
jgi:hypothetical protein